MLLRHRQAIVLEGQHAVLNGLSNVSDRRLLRLTFRDAARQARAFGNPKTVFAWKNDDLSHGAKIGALFGGSTPMISDFQRCVEWPNTKLSDPAHEGVRLRPERDGRVR